MYKVISNFLSKTVLLSLLLLCPLISGAQTYPDKSIKILQGFAPGGNADAIARAIGGEIAGALYNNLSYKTVQDFEMISTITYFPFLMVVPTDGKIANLPALIAQAKANPGKVAYGTAGIGSTHHLAGELFASMAKLDLLHLLRQYSPTSRLANSRRLQ